MLETLTAHHLIIIFSVTIIISYFFNLYAKRSGIPAVLLLIGLGIVINYGLRLSGFPKPNLLPFLEVLGIVGLILIVLEAALDLRLLKEKVGLIIKSFFVALIGLGATAYLAAVALYYLMGVEVLEGMLYTIPLSILSSAILLPSIEDLCQQKREFLIYESTFSDIVGIIGFYSVLTIIGSENTENLYSGVFGRLTISILFSIIISYILIYVFQNIKGPVKLFLLISILLLLYAVGEMLHLSSLIMILVFGVILNNYKVFFRGWLKSLLDEERVGGVLEDMKVVTSETAFVVRTFFFIIFGWSVFLGLLFFEPKSGYYLSFKVVGIGLVILFIIYFVRAVTLFLFNGKNIVPQVFLAPRGLITILLFFAIPEELSIGSEFQGVLLFVILISCLVMSWSLIYQKKSLARSSFSEEKGSLSDSIDVNLNEETIDNSIKEK